MRNTLDDIERLGREGEAVVRSWLKEQGYAVLPASLIKDTGAPMLTGVDLKLILPNNLTWQNKAMGWVEVKTKTLPSRHWTEPKRWEHGLPLSQWKAYKEISRVTGIPVTLAVLEVKNSLLLLSLLEQLQPGARTSLMHGRPHIFINRDDFHEWFSIQGELPEPIEPKANRTLKQGPSPLTRPLDL